MAADAWPWPGDSPLDRARRVARSYREALRRIAPEECERLDHHARDLGQAWVVPQMFPYQPDDQLDAHEVAEMCNVQVNTVRVWRTRGLPCVKTPDGQRFRVADVLTYQQNLRRRRARKHDSRAEGYG